MEDKSLIGRVVYSKVGRDKDRHFVVVGILNKEFVYIADGKLRKISKPKKKKLKHLIFTDNVAEEIRELILNGSKVSDLRIKRFLEAEYANKEV
ncbi:hypothetical protein CLTEP_08250 [Clostridium tepidiprofundi DSM 19306]|uniref:50S ribosomal protein L14e n=1 Tax=Clostridium tepidiprofundi DSM 19306 TaxID=1121338 RepID=A0A151B611_9CLOT|nr:KOW domain-containing RNA-binding protein [Clostridium tepidiprofundi]KYH35200.1 hypothetical protein CLTEP_08250 [Clostridium tepidiprofundi DSM 19306]